MRAARDRLIDMLGIGKTYPLRDLDVRAEASDGVRLTHRRKSPIEISQSDVLYSLYTRDGQPVHPCRAVSRPNPEGNGGTLILETPAIAEDSHLQDSGRQDQSSKT